MYSASSQCTRQSHRCDAKTTTDLKTGQARRRWEHQETSKKRRTRRTRRRQGRRLAETQQEEEEGLEKGDQEAEQGKQLQETCRTLT
jgi:hypothetical protein